ncbi:putative Zn(II)2Cys6 transcription factor [Phaeosphaeria sp. MPI-PUGE-AT-0046c]|nr:putative Zn(II)2Cys6 transcription factor [Phaeosphaeria sp. MPI-PUGE-AT-0046c]
MSAQPRRQQSGIACEECRRKRIRCDRGRPQCLACATSGVSCVVRDNCPPRGPKKGYLQTLQKRIEDLQNRLEHQSEPTGSHAELRITSPAEEETDIYNAEEKEKDSIVVIHEIQQTPDTTPMVTGQWQGSMASDMIMEPGPWEFMDHAFENLPFTGLESYQSPLQMKINSDLIITPMMHNDLDQLFFDRAYMFAPILQAHRYRSWSQQPSKSKQQICLQHAMWTLASSLSSQFQIAVRQLYDETRQLLHTLEHDDPYHQISLEQTQAWLLLALYELTNEDYHRGMISVGRALRFSQMMRLYDVDAPQGLPTAQSPGQDAGQYGLVEQATDDWIGVETKRRTFWLAYIIERFTSMVDGLHLFFNEQMIRTRLPASEADFASGRGADMPFLADMISVIDLEWPKDDLSTFTETVVGATMCGRVLEHKQRPAARTRDTTYEFCRRHRSLSALLAQRMKILSMFSSLEYLNPVLTFTALTAHISVLMLYDFIESNPLGTEAQATQLTKALYTEHHQQSLDAVVDTATLVAVLGQHFQTHPLTPVLLLAGAKFARAHPDLNDAYNKLMPCIVTTLQTSAESNRMAQVFLQQLGPPNEVMGVARMDQSS